MLQLLSLVYVCTIVQLSLSQDDIITSTTAASRQINSTEPSALTETQIVLRPIDKGAAPAYAITNFFLEVIISSPDIADLDQKINLSRIDTRIDFGALGTEWKVLVNHYTSYLVCLVLAAVYILGLIIAGLVVCGCRCSGKCGSKQSLEDGKYTKPKRRTCAVLLSVVWVFLLLGIVIMFMTNMLANEQIQQDGLPKVLTESVSRLDNFLDLAEETYENYFQETVVPEVKDLQDTIGHFGKNVQHDVLEPNINDLIRVLSAYIERLNETAENLIQFDGLVDKAKADVRDLTNKLNVLKINLTNDFTSCSTSGNLHCMNILNISSSLNVGVNFDSFQTLTDLAKNFSSPLSGDESVYVGYSLTQQEVNGISEKITNTSGNTVFGIANEVQNATNEAENFVLEALDFLDTVSLEDAMSFVNTTLNPSIIKYGRYWFYGTLAVSIMVLLIIAICTLALLFGPCAERAGGVNHYCNKGHASKLLMIAVGMIFIFAWILMVAPAVMLPVGGILHNDVCENLLNSKANSKSTEVVYDMVTRTLNLPFDSYKLYTSCSTDDSLYNALQLQNEGKSYDLSEILNPNKYDVEKFIEEIKDVSYKIGNITIVNDVLRSAVDSLVVSTSYIDLTNEKEELDKNILSENLKDFSLYLSAINITSLTETLEFYSKAVLEIHEKQYSNLLQTTELLKISLNAIESFKNDFTITSTLDELENAEKLITPNSVSVSVDKVADNILEGYEKILSEAEVAYRDELAQCGTVSNVITESLEVACVRFLYPFNAFWFSLGWCLFFFVLLIPINIILADFYKKTKSYQKSQRTLDDPFSRDIQRDENNEQQSFREDRSTEDPYHNLAYYNDFDDITRRAEPYYGHDMTSRSMYPDMNTARSEFRY